MQVNKETSLSIKNLGYPVLQFPVPKLNLTENAIPDIEGAVATKTYTNTTGALVQVISVSGILALTRQGETLTLEDLETGFTLSTLILSQGDSVTLTNNSPAYAIPMWVSNY